MYKYQILALQGELKGYFKPVACKYAKEVTKNKEIGYAGRSRKLINCSSSL